MAHFEKYGFAYLSLRAQTYAIFKFQDLKINQK